jgi:hypothetical protein
LSIDLVADERLGRVTGSVGDLIELVCNSIGAKTGPILNRADANGSIGSASIEEAPTRDRQPRGDVF